MLSSGRVPVMGSGEFAPVAQKLDSRRRSHPVICDSQCGSASAVVLMNSFHTEIPPCAVTLFLLARCFPSPFLASSGEPRAGTRDVERGGAALKHLSTFHGEGEGASRQEVLGRTRGLYTVCRRHNMVQVVSKGARRSVGAGYVPARALLCQALSTSPFVEKDEVLFFCKCYVPVRRKISSYPPPKEGQAIKLERVFFRLSRTPDTNWFVLRTYVAPTCAMHESDREETDKATIGQRRWAAVKRNEDLQRVIRCFRL